MSLSLDTKSFVCGRIWSALKWVLIDDDVITHTVIFNGFEHNAIFKINKNSKQKVCFASLTSVTFGVLFPVFNSHVILRRTTSTCPISISTPYLRSFLSFELFDNPSQHPVTGLCFHDYKCKFGLDFCPILLASLFDFKVHLNMPFSHNFETCLSQSGCKADCVNKGGEPKCRHSKTKLKLNRKRDVY